ncbi:IS66 family transposase [Myxococcus sp. RHSTA-1-4]|uniref:IS66 family transposase n=1 Tax=Myxococcus sp. RHSTA-1-4 TaxID=2874601 RepID=UPI001CBD014F|nr:IS66 family transposase [Myxococcus sp. RHSTA-1-4]MBZ4423364.1 IS66 family transposase [Myxococcus sp. RHSTA-1-4]
MGKKKRQPRPVDPVELAGIVERTRGTLSQEDFAKLKAAMDTLAFLTAELQAKGTSLERLRRLLFGAPTEKTDEVLRKAGQPPAQPPQGPAEDKARAPGHGRHAAAAYTGARREKVTHARLKSGEACQGCLRGKVYPLSEPAVRVRVTGMAPLSATVWECERLRCNLCGEVYTAQAPEGVGEEKYDETAVAMTGLLKYGTGLPFHRIEKLQEGLGIPLPATTQWQLVEAGTKKLRPAFDELVNQAAQAPVLHNDDTVMKVLALTKEQVQAAAAGEPEERTGVFTSGILAVNEQHPIALFFTGRQHAGENLADVLKQRAAELAAPIQMSDALARNVPGEFATVLANCLAHARRGFVDVATDFPAECKHVLEALREVYRVDAAARRDGLSPPERLALHQRESGPVMEKLKAWLDEQLTQRKVEPNSGLGHAIAYMRKHWLKLTLFLREEGAPLDNNVCERALKKAILHRKNALFYRTLKGAGVGDVFMSLIHTVELCEGNPFDYLVALLRHPEAVADAPGEWMPWNYQQALAAEDTPSAS